MRKHLTLAIATTALFASGAMAGRGDDGHVNIIYWQAASTLNPYLSSGAKDIESSSLIIEPLARYDESGNLVAWLAEDIPTLENGGISEDLTTITWQLKRGIKWSDGSDFTAEDVVFTAEYCMDPNGGCQVENKFADIDKVEAIGQHAVKVTFSVAKPFPYGPFTGAEGPIIQRAQFRDCMGPKAPTCTDQNLGPHGTGPFRVTEFRASDVIYMEANPHFRDPDKPAFATLTLKGGGDAASAARAVLETGEFDYAWNLQIDPATLAEMASNGNGTVVSAFGTSVERMMLNLTNPTASLGDRRSTMDGGPHPFLTDAIVRRALSLAVDRVMLADIGYGDAGKPTCNVLPAPARYASTAHDECLVQNIDLANRLLDEAGWMPGPDGIRERDGVRLSVLHQTSTNAVRQHTQTLLKKWWGDIGVETELRDIDPAVFFGGDPFSPDTFQKFYADIQMYTNLFNGTDPEAYMNNWTCDEIPSPENSWLGGNMPRYCNPVYDDLAAQLAKTARIEERAEIAKKMNDMLILEGAMIPLVHRGRVSAHDSTLGGVKLNTWDSELWNIADWHRVE